MHVFGAKITRIWYPLQIARGKSKTITSSFEHAVSDTFILIISERAPLEWLIFFHVCESSLRGSELRPSGATELGEGLPGQGKFLHFEPEKTVSDAYILGKDY